MRLGVISDLHADAGALARAFDVLERRGADRVVCLGDTVEKGDDGDRVVDELRAHAVACVRGNHDEGAARAHREGWAERPLRDDTAQWLEALPRVRSYVWEGVRVTLAHGTPSVIDEYVFPDKVPKRFRRELRAHEGDLLLLGHTHRPMSLRAGHVWVVNPGSVAVGRSRDSHSCALLDLRRREVAFHDLATGDAFPVRETSLSAKE
ncbi:MAG: YfcE family phosphodiesterase [Polyangiales bacterium]